MFIQLLVINRTWRIQHHITAAVFFEGNEVADGFAAAENGAKTIEPQGLPPGGGGAYIRMRLKGIKSPGIFCSAGCTAANIFPAHVGRS